MMILLISCVFPPEPVVSATLANDLAIALSEITEVKVLTPRPSRPFGFSFKEEADKKREFEQIVVDSFTYARSKIAGRMLESYSFGKHAVNYIKKNRHEIKCIYLNVWPLLAQYLIVNISKKYLIPTIIHVQDIYPESLSNRVQIFDKVIRKSLLHLDKYTLSSATRVIAISDNMASTLVKTRDISPEKIEIIYNWQNETEFINNKELKEFQKTNRSYDKIFTFMYLGNIGPVAGVEFLIKSFTKANIQGALLVIAGSGSKKNECIKIAESFKNSNVRFCDVPEGSVPETQEKADVLLLPAKRGAAMSSVPSKMIAYMFSGKPVIACVDKESDTANTIKQADCGWLVSPEDPAALIEVMNAVVAKPEKDLRRMGTNGFNYAMENFSREKNLYKLIKIILETAAV